MATHPDTQPDHVTLTYDESWLQTYRPMLVLRELDVRPNSMHAWRATSTEHDLDVGCYWAEYPYQQGVSEYDSHLGDHEPIYVLVDGNGDVDSVIYSGYHWLAARTESPTLYDGTHPQLYAVSPWHHYLMTGEQGEFVDLEPLTESFSSWLDNGLEDDLDPGSVVNPWTMTARSDWWREDITGVSFNALYIRALYRAGFHGAEYTDLNN